MPRSPRRSLFQPAAALLTVFLCLRAPPARACVTGGELLLIGAVAVLTPSEVGLEAATGTEATQLAPVIGWAYQIPIPLAQLDPPSRNRLAFSLEWVPGGRGADVRARLGYRYARGPLEVGLGATTGPDHARLSPELGLRLGGADFLGAHVRARLELAPTLLRDVRALVTVGWSLL
jgi:hypothetical protein